MADSPEPEFDLDGEEEPLFADDLEDLDDPPLLPPPLPAYDQLSSGNYGDRVGASATRSEPQNAFTSLATGAGSEDPTAGQDGGGDPSAGGDPPEKKKRKPLLTLTIDRVFSEKGLPYLKNEFPKLKFKGKGHEAADLKYLLKQYEHWANTLYPKLTFKDVTNRIEGLATKKEFKTKLSQLRRQCMSGGAGNAGGLGLAGSDDQDEGEGATIFPTERDAPTSPPQDNGEDRGVVSLGNHEPPNVTRGSDDSDEDEDCSDRGNGDQASPSRGLGENGTLNLWDVREDYGRNDDRGESDREGDVPTTDPDSSPHSGGLG